MEQKTYGVHITKTTSAVILVSAKNEDQAHEHAQLLIDEGSATLTDDLSLDDDFEIGEVDEETIDEGSDDEKDLIKNDREIRELASNA